MLRRNESGLSRYEAVSLCFMAAMLVVALMTVPGFPYRPFHAPSESRNPSEASVVPPQSDESPMRTVTVPKKRLKERSRPAQETEPETSAESHSVDATETIATPPPSVPSPVVERVSQPRIVEESEPVAPDGFHRGTIVRCRHESNVPGSPATLCVDLGTSVVSVAASGRPYVQIGGWNRRVPLYPEDVIRFEVNHGELVRLELLSDPKGR